MSQVSSSSSYSSNPSTNLSTIAGATPGKLPNQQQSATSRTSPDPGLHIHVPTSNANITAPRKASAGGTSNGINGTSNGIERGGNTSSTTASAPTVPTSATLSSPPTANQPAWHSDTQTIVTSATHIPASNPINPVSLTPELNEQLTKAYLPQHTGNQWIADLVQKMELARSDIDKRAAEQQQQISEEATQKVNQLLDKHKQQQDGLMRSSQSRTQEIDAEFNKKREAALHQLEHQKGSIIAALEKDLIDQQKKLTDQTNKLIEQVAEDARIRKLAVKEEAQRKADQLGASAHIEMPTNGIHGGTTGSTTINNKH